jgi:hypothetical protein
MSRSTPTLTNPSKHFFRWKDGKITYYSKEKQSDIEVKLPFEFLVLDQLATITGFCEPDNSGYWSNEVRKVAEEPFTVKTGKGVKQSGLYKDLTDVRSKGAKYAKSIYIAYFDPEYDALVIGNMQVSGASLTAWIDASKKYVVDNGKLRITGATEATKGKVTFYVPTFEWLPSETVEDETAIKLDKELQVYLSQYLAPRPNVFDKDDDMQSLIDSGEPLNEEEMAEMPEGFLKD